jgi:hypothetical protein
MTGQTIGAFKQLNAQRTPCREAGRQRPGKREGEGISCTI